MKADIRAAGAVGLPAITRSGVNHQPGKTAEQTIGEISKSTSSNRDQGFQLPGKVINIAPDAASSVQKIDGGDSVDNIARGESAQASQQIDGTDLGREQGIREV